MFRVSKKAVCVCGLCVIDHLRLEMLCLVCLKNNNTRKHGQGKRERIGNNWDFLFANKTAC